MDTDGAFQGGLIAERHVGVFVGDFNRRNPFVHQRINSTYTS